MFSVKYFLMRKLSHIDKCNSETMCGGYILGFFWCFGFWLGFFCYPHALCWYVSMCNCYPNHGKRQLESMKPFERREGGQHCSLQKSFFKPSIPNPRLGKKKKNQYLYEYYCQAEKAKPSLFFRIMSCKDSSQVHIHE